MDVEAIYESARSAVAKVTSEAGEGAGFFIDPRGLLLTNGHVVGDLPLVDIEMHDGGTIKGRVVRRLRSTDLAFVMANASVPFGCLPLADDRDVRVGVQVIVIGHPHGLRNSVSQGIVSGLDRSIGGVSYLQIDAPINPGNSGGPVLGPSGHVLGVATLGLAEAQGINFAIPPEVVRRHAAPLLSDFAGLSTSQYCKVCGGSQPSSARHCHLCGAAFTTKKLAFDAGAEIAEASWCCEVCGKAGSELRPRYCPRCGASL